MPLATGCMWMTWYERGPLISKQQSFTMNVAVDTYEAMAWDDCDGSDPVPPFKRTGSIMHFKHLGREFDSYIPLSPKTDLCWGNLRIQRETNQTILLIQANKKIRLYYNEYSKSYSNNSGPEDYYDFEFAGNFDQGVLTSGELNAYGEAVTTVKTVFSRPRP